MILATQDVDTSPDLTRAAFARAGEPKRLLEVDGDHYSVYPWSKGQNYEKVVLAATEWFAEHLGVE